MAKTIRYYIAEGELIRKIDALFDADKETRKAAARLKREIAADKFFTGELQCRVVGFSFADENAIDKKLWRRHPRHGIWQPRRGVKAGRELWERMNKIRFSSGGDFAAVIGVKTFFGGRWATPGVERIGDTYLLTVDGEAGTPQGCRRISDIEAEELRKPKRKRRKAS